MQPFSDVERSYAAQEQARKASRRTGLDAAQALIATTIIATWFVITILAATVTPWIVGVVACGLVGFLPLAWVVITEQPYTAIRPWLSQKLGLAD